MKGIVTLAVILVVFGAGIWWFIMRETLGDQGTMLLVVFGNPQDETIELHVSVGLVLTVREKPRLNAPADVMWDDWIAQHFDLRDADGSTVPFTRIAHSLLVDENKAKNIPEFYVKYVLKKGQTYTLDHIPRAGKKARHRYTFTAPSEAQEFQRVQFEAVEK